MKDNPLLKLAGFGQSIWIDFIRRGMIRSGELGRLIEEDGVRGVTSNPSIFEKAIDGSHDYDSDIRDLALQGKTPEQIYETVTVADVRMAADLFRSLYDRLGGRDGFVSLEVSPLLAHDTDGTISEARRLWQEVDRPNVFIKVPATREGLPAIARLIGEGININITLLFGLPRYHDVVEAYMTGLKTLAAKGRALDRVASVASFFLSRIDVMVDPMLARKAGPGGSAAGAALALKGQAALASAKIAYRMLKDLFAGPDFRKLAEKGAQVQRLLWASTSAKDPTFSDVKYVEPLIGRDTINTVPLETLNAYRDHGQPDARIESGVEEAHRVLAGLAEQGIDLAKVTQKLEDEGIEKFVQAFDRLRTTIAQRSAESLRDAQREKGMTAPRKSP